MSLLRLRARAIFVILICAGLRCAHAQQAVSSIAQVRQARELSASTNPKVDANGTLLSEDDETTSDESLGDLVILKSPPRAPTFVVTGDASVFYTNNAALTRRHRIDDSYLVANAGLSWTPVIAPGLAAQVSAQGSIFRYHSTSVLDFESLNLGAGLFWNPEHFAGVGLYARYDFIELLDRHSNEILRDHEFTIGAQRVFPLGPAHAIVTGAILRAGLAEPDFAQRNQAGVFLSYRLQATRSLGFEFLYRFAGYFYNDPGRTDRNQILSASAHYRLQDWADINLFFSFVDNHSDDSAFNYDAVSNGGGLSATFQF